MELILVVVVLLLLFGAADTGGVVEVIGNNFNIVFRT